MTKTQAIAQMTMARERVAVLEEALLHARREGAAALDNEKVLRARDVQRLRDAELAMDEVERAGGTLRTAPSLWRLAFGSRGPRTRASRLRRLSLWWSRTMVRYPIISIERKDNGWLYTLRTSGSAETEGVHPDGSPLVLKFWAPKGIEGEDFTLTLDEDRAKPQETQGEKAEAFYPNIEALANGTISGSFSEWPKVRSEAKAILAELSSLRAEPRARVEKGRADRLLERARMAESSLALQRERIRLAREALCSYGSFAESELTDDIAPRIIELSCRKAREHDAMVEEAARETERDALLKAERERSERLRVALRDACIGHADNCECQGCKLAFAAR